LQPSRVFRLRITRTCRRDKEGFFDAEKQVINCVDIMAEMLGAISFKVRNMQKAAEGEFCCATDVADYLAKRGVPFRTAHSIVGRIVRSCIESGKTLQTMTADEYRTFAPEFGDDIVDSVKGKACADARTSLGGGSAENVKAEIKSLKKRLKRYM
ncbi:MAG: argininosuccinate lyase, partial [Clostridia bacterium]|nr:argininosuccinate lyase [Clostridia bacterium]